jgi:hypothetical protein
LGSARGESERRAVRVLLAAVRVSAAELLAAGGQVSLGEDQVDDPEHGAEPGSEVVGPGDAVQRP